MDERKEKKALTTFSIEPSFKAELEELFAACVLDPALNKHKKLMKLAKKE